MSALEKRDQIFFGQEPWHKLGKNTPARLRAKHLLHDCEPMKITRPAEVFDENAILRAIDEYAIRHRLGTGEVAWLDSSSRSIVVLNDQNALEAAVTTIVDTFVAAQTDTLNFWYIVGRANIDCDLAEEAIKNSDRFSHTRQANGDWLVRLGKKEE